MVRNMLSHRLRLQPLEDRTTPAVHVVAPLTDLPPTANDDFAGTDGANPVTLDVLENDAAVGSRTLNHSSVKVLSGPSHGTLSIDPATGDITYRATGSFQGTDAFQYTVSDSSGAVSNRATVSVVVHRPTANDDFAETSGSAPVTIPVLENDSTEIDPTRVKLKSAPTYGTAVIDSASGEITYTANAAFSGTDTLRYTITDASGAESAPATVTIIVNGTGTVTGPTAEDDAADTDGTNAVEVSILDNDSAPLGSSLDPTSVNITSNPQRGSVTVDPSTGIATYTATGFFIGTDSFAYTVRDAAGKASNIAKVTIIVNRPTANDDSADTDGNNPVTLDLLANDTDPDGNGEIDPTTVKVVTTPTHGTVSIDPMTGAATYTANGFFQGTDTFRYTITDKAGAESAPGTVTIVINRPTANPDAGTTVGSIPVAIDVLANDTDPDGNAEIDPASVRIVTGPSHGTVSVDATGRVTYTPNGSYIGSDVFTYTVTDFPGAESNVAPIRIRVDSAMQQTAVGAGPGAGPRVNVYAADGSLRASFFAYDASFRGGVRVAMGDVNGDNIPDIVTAAGPGGGPHVKLFDGVTLKEISGFFAYAAEFRGGMTVSVGDVNGDGIADIVTGAGVGGGPHVKVFDGANGRVLQSFFAYAPSFRGGVTVTTGDIDGDGHADVVTGVVSQGGPHVKVFSGSTGATLQSFFAFAPDFLGGVTVAAGDVNGDGLADIITGAGPGGSPQVKVFNGKDDSTLANFFAFDASFTGGVRVATGDVNADGHADILAAPGAGSLLTVTAFDGITLNPITTATPFGEFHGGVYVGAAG